jgi:hypothetical protein
VATIDIAVTDPVRAIGAMSIAVVTANTSSNGLATVD